MSTEQNKAVVRRFIERELNTMDLAVVDEILAPDYVNHMVPGGREGFKKFDAMMRSGAGFKMDITIEHLVAEGDYVVARITYHVSNAGKEVTASELSEYRVVNGKIAEDWPPTGAAALMQQVGIKMPGM
jgi:predicted SnoaL-like aldol condensation-catalyzing enzyme